MEHGTQSNAHHSSDVYPMARLPAELLSGIFVEVIDQNSWNDAWVQYQQVARLILVCRLWKQTADSTPAIWSRINVNFPIRVVKDILVRSGTYPLVVDDRSHPSTKAQGTYPKFDLVDRRESLILIQSSIPRCQEMLLGIKAGDEAARLVATGFPAPLLERLVLDARQLYEPLRLFRDTAPRLRHVVFAGQLSFDSPLLEGLRTLEIEWIGDEAPTHRHILSILRNCPQIEKLITRGFSSDYKELSPSEFELMELPRLELLVLGWGLPSILYGILQHIHAPSLRLLTCILSYLNDDPVIPINSELHRESFLAFARGFLGKATRYVIEIREASITLNYTDDPCARNLAISSIDWECSSSLTGVFNPLSWLIDEIEAGRHPGAEEVTISLWNFPPHHLPAVSRLAKLPKITAIRVYHMEAVNDLLEFLHAPPNDDGPLSMPFRELKSLTFGRRLNRHTLTKLTQTLKSRYNAQVSGGRGSSHSNIQPLEELTLLKDEHLPVELVDELIAVVGVEVVRFL